MNGDAVSEWFSAALQQLGAIRPGDLVLWLLSVAVVVVIVRLIRRWALSHVRDVNRRHSLRKLVGYIGFFIVLAVAIALFVGRFGQVAAFLGILAAGLAIALQDVGKSAAGWLYLASHSGLGPGSRIQVGEVLGEVIDVGVLKTTVLEVGNLVKGRQSSGRLATIPNSRFLNDTFYASPSYSPYAWNELSFLLTYESDWRKGVRLLEELGRREFEGMEAETAASFRQLERRFAFKYGPLTPIVYVVAADSGVELTLRYLVHIRRRRGSSDRVTRGMLEIVEREPDLDFAYPTTRIYRRREEEIDAALPALVDLERLPLRGGRETGGRAEAEGGADGAPG